MDAKLVEVVTALANAGHIDEALQLIPASKKEAANSRSFYDYMLDSEESFLNDVAKGIKQVARSHAEKVRVQRGRSAVWLEYEGQDRSDLDMEVSISVDSAFLKGNQVVVLFRVKKTLGGYFDDRMEEALGVLTPQLVVDKFYQYFGGH